MFAIYEDALLANVPVVVSTGIDNITPVVVRVVTRTQIILMWASVWLATLSAGALMGAALVIVKR